MVTKAEKLIALWHIGTVKNQVFLPNRLHVCKICSTSARPFPK
jgi:hypothetical protein